MAKVLVTGGNKGIGLEITRLFLKNGDETVVVARDFKEFEFAGDPRVTVIPFDLSDTERVPGLVKQIGEVDVIVNNAGISTSLRAEEYTERDRLYITNLDLATPIALITAYLPHFKKIGGGRVVNIASQAGVFGHFDIWYGALKAGLINATKTFAGVYGRDGLVINSVAPGPVDIPKIRGSKFGGRFEKVIGRTILKRYAYPEEVARVVWWLAKESPEYLNGDNYLINNGVTSLDA